MNKRLWIVAIIVALGTSVLARAADQPKAKPSQPPGTQVHRDMEYIAGGHARNKLDLIMHGEEDKMVPMNQSTLLDEALRKAGVESTLVRVPKNGHGGPGFTTPESRKTIADFFDKHLK